nr:T-cell surface glycoprotein CD3 epsilon chain isoform X2 [Dromaius novaehollandiae]
MAEKSRRRNTRMRFELSLLLLGLMLCVVGTAAQEEDAEAEEGPAPGQEFLVEISGTTVTITCPITESNIVWKSTLSKPDDNVRKYVIENYDSSPVNVSCSSGDQKHSMYLNARARTGRGKPALVPAAGHEVRRCSVLLLFLTQTMSPSGRASGKCMQAWNPGASEIPMDDRLENSGRGAECFCAA